MHQQWIIKSKILKESFIVAPKYLKYYYKSSQVLQYLYANNYKNGRKNSNIT